LDLICDLQRDCFRVHKIYDAVKRLEIAGADEKEFEEQVLHGALSDLSNVLEEVQKLLPGMPSRGCSRV
jgi:hypothetical protein